MSISADEQLSRYYDGELPPEEAAALEAQLADDEGLRAKLDGLTHLSTLIRESTRDVAADLDSEGLFDAIAARFDESAPGDAPLFPEEVSAEAPTTSHERPALRVVHGGKSGIRPARDSRLDRRTNTMMAFGGLAAAAAVAFAVISGPVEGVHPAPETAPILAVAPPPGSEVEAVDFGANTGAIFSVEGQAGEQYAVIWISDAKVEDPIDAELQEEQL